MSQAQTIDDSKVQSTIDQLNAKLSQISQQQQEIRNMIRTLQKIQTVVIRTDVIDNVPKPVTAPPTDPDTGAPMTDERRLAIFNAVMPRSQTILGIISN